MSDNLPSISIGSISAVLGTTFWDFCADAGTTVLIAFIGGMAGYAGKRFIEYLIKRYRKK